MIAIAASIAALLLSPELPAQGTAPNTAVWLDELDLKAMAQRRGVMLKIGRPIATDTAN
jgi:hypothetical protein